MGQNEMRPRPGLPCSVRLTEGLGGMLDEQDIYRLSIRTSFMRPDAPLLIDTAALRHLKCFAMSAMSSSFALPSMGRDLS